MAGRGWRISSTLTPLTFLHLELVTLEQERATIIIEARRVGGRGGLRMADFSVGEYAKTNGGWRFVGAGAAH